MGDNLQAVFDIHFDKCGEGIISYFKALGLRCIIFSSKYPITKGNEKGLQLKQICNPAGNENIRLSALSCRARV